MTHSLLGCDRIIVLFWGKFGKMNTDIFVGEGIKYRLDHLATKYVKTDYPFLMEPGLEETLREQIKLDPKFVLEGSREESGEQIYIVSFDAHREDYIPLRGEFGF